MRRWRRVLPAIVAWAAFAAALGSGGRFTTAKLYLGCTLPADFPNTHARPLSSRSVNALFTLAADPEASCPEFRSRMPQTTAWLTDRLNLPLALISTPSELALAAGKWRPARQFIPASSWAGDQDLLRAIHRMNTFFLDNDGIDKRLFGDDRLVAAAASAETQAAVIRILTADRHAVLSETGGIAILRYPPGAPPVIDFIPLASALDPITSRLLELRDDPAAVIAFVDQHLDRLDAGQEETAIFLREARKLTDPLALANRTQMFVDHWQFNARLSYVFWESALICHLLERPVSGTFLGIFHVHPPDNPPSWADKLVSAFHRELILVPQADGFDLHALAPGNAASTGLKICVRGGQVVPNCATAQ